MAGTAVESLDGLIMEPMIGELVLLRAAGVDRSPEKGGSVME